MRHLNLGRSSCGGCLGIVLQDPGVDDAPRYSHESEISKAAVINKLRLMQNRKRFDGPYFFMHDSVAAITCPHKLRGHYWYF